MSRKPAIPKIKGVKSKGRESSAGLYRKVVISFVVLTAILILVILYFSFVSTEISLIPRPQKHDISFTVEVMEGEDGLLTDQINGVFFEKEVTGEKEFMASGSKPVASGEIGRVKITNNYRRSQPLVATTRLLSADQTLVRISSRVDIAPGKSVEVDVYADNPKILEGRTIPAGTKFTIPGLHPSLQDKIYAEAVSPIGLGEKKVLIVTDDDIVRAKDELLKQLEAQSFAELGLDSKVAKAVVLEEKESEIDARAGDEKERFRVKVRALVRGVFFDKDSLLRLAENKLKSGVPIEEQLIGVDYDSLVYSIEKLDTKAKAASIKVQFSGTSVIHLNSPVIAKEKLKGMNKGQLENYLSGQNTIESFQVKFFPFWVKTVPQLMDHINIRVQENE
ncbi:MAG: hypothetical protein WC310_00935 [Patescibacteria group bacterium]|jgi:hypothetical protein